MLLLILYALAGSLRGHAEQPSPLKPPATCSMPSDTVTLAAVGDILLDRGVAAKIQQYGMGYPFQHTTSLLAAADIAFGNLECPLATHGVKVHKKYCFKPDPATVQCLTAAGMDMLSLANNHSMDCGRIGLDETMATLKTHGLRWCGAGETLGGAEQPTLLDIKGIKIAFVGFCQFLPEGSFLRDDAPTIAFASEEAVRRAVVMARQQADVVIASFHWGEEYYSWPHDNQVQLAHAAVNAGADLVLGHHPHVFQALEVVNHQVGGHTRPALIAYSLGNFVFDAPRAWDSHTAETFILRCTLNRHGLVAAEALPVYIDKCRPRPVGGAQAQAILARLAKLSRARHTTLRARQISLTSKLPDVKPLLPIQR